MLVIQHLKGYMPSVILALNLLKQVGGAFLHAESHGFVLGRKGYYIFIALSMPLVPHSFILSQSSTLAEHLSSILFAEGKSP
jgi:hypothetical protein